MVESQRFSVPVIGNTQNALTIPALNQTVAIRPLMGNAITPQTIAPPGITAPLIYVQEGELHQLNGKEIAGAVILMEMESGKNWLQVANLGAQALIYVDRREASRLYFEEKFELSPIQFPRFWMPISQIQGLFGAFETSAEGRVANQVSLVSQSTWQVVTAENIYCFIPGTDSKLQEQLIMVEAFYDSTALVAGLSPGADEACSIATLLDLARILKQYPPQRSVVLVATAGHAQGLAGMRELVWCADCRDNHVS